MLKIFKLFSIVVAFSFITSIVSAKTETEEDFIRYLVDYTGIWYNPNTPGWGINFSQTNEFIFATIFVYDKNGKPIWYTGEMKRQHTFVCTGSWQDDSYIDYDYCGYLYRTESDSAPSDIFSPRNTETKLVGLIHFDPISPTEANLKLSFFDSREQSNSSRKELNQKIVRQTLTIPDLPMDCIGYAHRQSKCDYAIYLNHYVRLPEFQDFPSSIGGRSSALRLILTDADNTSNKMPTKVEIQIGKICSFSSDSISVVGQYLVLHNAETFCGIGSLPDIPKGTGDVWLRFLKNYGIDGYYRYKNNDGAYRHSGFFTGAINWELYDRLRDIQ